MSIVADPLAQMANTSTRRLIHYGRKTGKRRMGVWRGTAMDDIDPDALDTKVESERQRLIAALRQIEKR